MSGVAPWIDADLRMYNKAFTNDSLSMGLNP